MLRLRPYKPADAGYLMKWLEDERTVEFWKADRFCWPLTAEQRFRCASSCSVSRRGITWLRLRMGSPLLIFAQSFCFLWLPRQFDQCFAADGNPGQIQS